MSWVCPGCKQPLMLNERTYRCENGHCFDLAKQGYVNLLLAQNKSSLSPGDSAEMVEARRSFLGTGHYDHLVKALNDRVGPESNINTLLDLGCGEGYYSGSIKHGLSSDFECYGIDISKEAIRRAAGKYKSMQFAVASAFDIPLGSKTVDAVLCVFAPLSAEEVERVLKPNGVLIRVTPGARHLNELKSCLYDQVNTHEAAEPPRGFLSAHTETISKKILLTDNQQVRSLLTMTPFYWASSSERKQQLLGEQNLEVQTEFVVEKFLKPGS